MRSVSLAISTLIVVVGLMSPARAQDAGPEYRLEQVRGDLYRFSAGGYRSMVWATEEGLVVLDTLNRPAATWLKAELAKRFNAPVRYVIYSHDHHDHSYGGDVFDDPSIIFIAHERAREQLILTRAKTRLPELTFQEEMALTLGDETLRLRYHGPNNGEGSISMLFERHKTLFVVDWIVAGRLPWKSFEGYDVEGVIRSTREALSLDWEVFVGGHADVSDRKGVERYLAYIEALHGAVRDGMLKGQSKEALMTSITLEMFSDLKQYEAWRAQNVAAIYDQLARDAYLLSRPEVGPAQ